MEKEKPTSAPIPSLWLYPDAMVVVLLFLVGIGWLDGWLVVCSYFGWFSSQCVVCKSTFFIVVSVVGRKERAVCPFVPFVPLYQ